MNFGCQIDTSNLKVRTMREQKRLAYSVSQAINETLLKVQLGERANLDKKFEIRRAGFMYRLVKVTFANVRSDRPWGECYIDATKSRVLLSIFEGGGDKQPAVGRSVAVPVTGGPARPSFASPVNDQYTFQALHFQKVALTQAGRALKSMKGPAAVSRRLPKNYYIWAGANNTFILPSTKAAPYGGVFQRVGPGRDDIRLVYEFEKNPKLKKMLGFTDVAQQIIGAEFEKQFNLAYNSGKGA